MNPLAQDCAIRVQKVIDHIDFGYFAYPTRFSVEPTEQNVVLQICMETRDIGTGKRIELIERFTIEPADISDRSILMIIRQAVLFILKHELDENFCYQGTRVTEPHEGPPSPKRL